MTAPKIEMEKVTIELPKAMMDFLRNQKEDIAKYIQYSLISVFHADLDNGSVFSNYSEILRKYQLASVFRVFGVC
jgi:hypothetical protein